MRLAAALKIVLWLWLILAMGGPVRATDAPSQPCGGAWLGVSLDPPPAGRGARITAVETSGPAGETGLRAGDIITAIGSLAVGGPPDVAKWVAEAQPGDDEDVAVLRQGRALTLRIQVWAVPRDVCLARQRLAAMAAQAGQAAEAAPAADRPAAADAIVHAPGVRADGSKAMVAVGGFEVKAAKATGAIGDGLREMLVSALHQSGYFVVVEREDLRGVLAEQDLSRSPLARDGSAVPASIDVADVMVFGAVTEFEPQAGGSSFMTPMRGVPLAMGARISWAQLALDVRVVDVRSGRVLGAERIPGMARFAQATIAGAVPVAGGLAIPTGLSVYRNTPMEWAIRECLRKTGYFVINSIGDEYYRHR